MFVAGLIALLELVVGERTRKREIEQLVLAFGDGFDFLLDLSKRRGVILLCGKGAQIVDVLLHGG